jgi:hypothetical protein
MLVPPKKFDDLTVEKIGNRNFDDVDWVLIRERDFGDYGQGVDRNCQENSENGVGN